MEPCWSFGTMGNLRRKGGDITISIFSQHGDLEKARVMKTLLIMSPLLGDP